MRFEPKTEEEIIKENLLQPGIYDFEVREATDKLSKAGNDMIHLKLSVFDEDGNSVFVDDYLLESMALKLRRAAAACGLLDEYERGELAGFDFEGKAGKVKIKIDKGKQKPDSDEFYPDRNAVDMYIVSKEPGVVSAKPTDALLDDEIPF